ncbi:GNAT family N-acetyltransferase [Phenylobacterium sp.]|uniref:GNAT family N-acetyltransferase n=1 Tax=Phenylobacterium sp. TaxID=1871053 RepID=UPI0035B183A0
MPHETRDADGYLLSDDPARFDVALAHQWIAGQSYWAQGIPFDTFARACAGSLTVGAYAPDGAQAGMARVVTDRATFGWVCDVFVDEAARGAGVGKRLMAYLTAHPDLQGFRRMHLATRDAHALYARFGFEPLSGADRWMQVYDPDVYRR